MDFKKFLKKVFTLKDMLFAAAAVLGALGSINWINIPVWLYISIFVAYGLTRYLESDEK